MSCNNKCSNLIRDCLDWNMFVNPESLFFLRNPLSYTVRPCGLFSDPMLGQKLWSLCWQIKTRGRPFPCQGLEKGLKWYRGLSDWLCVTDSRSLVNRLFKRQNPRKAAGPDAVSPARGRLGEKSGPGVTVTDRPTHSKHGARAQCNTYSEVVVQFSLHLSYNIFECANISNNVS